MTVQELQEIMGYFGTLGLGAMIGGGILYLVVKSFIPSYLAEKAKNLATREDIAAITKEIEGVKADYAKQLQELQHQNTLLAEGFKFTLTKEQDFTRTINTAVVELTKKLAAGSHQISWLAWAATQIEVSLSMKDFKVYDAAMMTVMSDLVGLQASVAALDSKKFDVLSPFAEELYERDIEVGAARDAFLKDRQNSINRLKAVYHQSIAFDARLLKAVTNILRAPIESA